MQEIGMSCNLLEVFNIGCMGMYGMSKYPAILGEIVLENPFSWKPHCS